MPIPAPTQHLARPTRRPASVPQQAATPRARCRGRGVRRQLLPVPPGEGSWLCPQAPPPGAGSRSGTRIYLVGLGGKPSGCGAAGRERAAHHCAAPHPCPPRRPTRAGRVDAGQRRPSRGSGYRATGVACLSGSIRQRAGRGWHVRGERHCEEGDREDDGAEPWRRGEACLHVNCKHRSGHWAVGKETAIPLTYRNCQRAFGGGARRNPAQARPVWRRPGMQRAVGSFEEQDVAPTAADAILPT